MGMNDTETVGLIGGGHAFGRCHGPCENPPCGRGRMRGIGANAFTSGIDGEWTLTPTVWTNDYFKNLLDYEWNVITGPGGAFQWEPTDPKTGEPGPEIIMLTADLALINDDIYKPIV